MGYNHLCIAYLPSYVVATCRLCLLYMPSTAQLHGNKLELISQLQIYYTTAVATESLIIFASPQTLQ